MNDGWLVFMNIETPNAIRDTSCTAHVDGTGGDEKSVSDNISGENCATEFTTQYQQFPDADWFFCYSWFA